MAALQLVRGMLELLVWRKGNRTDSSNMPVWEGGDMHVLQRRYCSLCVYACMSASVCLRAHARVCPHIRVCAHACVSGAWLCYKGLGVSDACVFGCACWGVRVCECVCLRAPACMFVWLFYHSG